MKFRLFITFAASSIAAAPQLAFADACAAPANAIVAENCNAGSPASQWDIGTADANLQGFAASISVGKGEAVRFKIKSNASSYRLDIYRLGYYQGNGARRVASIRPSVSLPQSQPACINQTATTGLVDCGNWAESASWLVPSTATSGIYLAKLVRMSPEDGRSNHIVFVVRDDAGASDILFQTADTTWQAYESYGGNNFYDGNGLVGDGSPPEYNRGRALKVSYNRPFTDGLDKFFRYELPMVRWLERNGYDVSYFTGVDSARLGGEILEHRLFLSVGHDEYWSHEQRNNVEAARDAGVHLAFFSGNEVYWKTRWENSVDGSNAPFRTLVCYKEPFDGVDDPSPEWTGQWQMSPSTRPENGLTGNIYNDVENESPMSVPARFGKLRFWRNTSVAALPAGSTATIGGSLLGYEWNEDYDNGHRPAGLIRLSSSTILVAGVFNPAEYRTHHMTLYRAASGALVFGAGSIQAAWALDPGPFRGYGWFEDARMKQAYVNLFADMNVQPGNLEAGLAPAAPSADVQPPAIVILTTGAALNTLSLISGTASDATGQVGAIEFSTDGARYHPALGADSWRFWHMPLQNAPFTVYVRATDDSGNSSVVSRSIDVTGGPACQAISVSAAPASGQPTNGLVRFSASASCSNGGTAVYGWAVRNPSGTVTLVQNYSASASLDWKPAASPNSWNPGAYQMSVLVKHQDSAAVTASSAAVDFSLTAIDASGPGTIYEDAEDSATTGWVIYANPGGVGSVANIIDAERGGRVIELSGAGWDTGYRLGTAAGPQWNNSSQFIADWSVKYSSNSTFYFYVQTASGPYFLQYNSWGSTEAAGDYLILPLGSDLENGRWNRIVRNLQTDLNLFLPGVALQRVDEFLMRGSGRIDDVALRSAAPPPAAVCSVTSLLAVPSTGQVINASVALEANASCTNSGAPHFRWSVKNPSGTWARIQDFGPNRLTWKPSWTANAWNPGVYEIRVEAKDTAAASTQSAAGVQYPLAPIPASFSRTLYEDAEDGATTGWEIYANPGGVGSVANVFDAERGGRVIELSGAGWDTGYRLGAAGGPAWNNSAEFIADWSVKYSSNSTFYFYLQTTAGPIFLQYNSWGSTEAAGDYYTIPLGGDIENGKWSRIVRNLQTDVNLFLPGVTVQRVNEFLMRGSGRIDDVYLRAASSPTAPNEPPAVPGLIGQWNFEEGSGLNAYDSSVTKASGTLQNGTGWVAVGKVGRALNFDGADDHVELGNPAALRLTGAMTAMAWIRVESDANNGRIISKQGYAGDRGWSLSTEGGEISFQIASDPGTVQEVAVPGVFNDWVHVAAVYEPGAAMRLYLNGAQAGQKTTSIPSSQFDSSQNVNIGRRPDGCCAFDGQIDQVRLFSRALNASEVNQIYQAEQGPPPDTQAPSAPGGFTATALSTSSVRLAWQASSDNVAVTGYAVTRGTIALTSVNATSYIDAGLLSGTTYSYAVRAFDAAGNNSATATASTSTFIAIDVASPTIIVQSPAAGATTYGPLLLSGTAADNVGVARVELRIGTQPWVTAAFGSNAWNYAVNTSSHPNGENVLFARAFDAAGNMGAAQQRFFIQNSTSGPNPPASLRAVAVSSSHIQLAWNAAFNDTGVAGFWVYRNSTSAWIAASTGPSYVDRGLSPSTTYTYWVRAFDANGSTSGYSAPASTRTAAPPSAPQIPGLVGSWSFDEGSGTSAFDASASKATGTLRNGPGWTAGKQGGALNFDGSDDHVDLGNPAPLRLTGAMTAAAWIRVESDANNGRIVSKQGFSGDRGWSLSAEGGEISFQIAADGGTVHEVTAPGIFNQWAHVAAVFDPGAAMRIYLNGALVSQKTAAIPGAQFNSSQNVNIGRRPDGCCAFDGQIDEVKLFNRALGAAEVDQLFRMEPGPAPDTEAPSVPGAFTAAPQSTSSIQLSWSASGDNVGVAGYHLMRGTVSLASQPGTSYADLNLTAGTTYQYSVRAFDAAGNFSAFAAASTATFSILDFSSPTVPTGLTVLGVGATRVDLSWSAASDDARVQGYFVYRNESSTPIAATTSTVYADSSALANSTYTYRVAAFDPAGNRSGWSAAVSTRTLNIDRLALGLIGYWKFDEAGGSFAFDASVSKATGTLVNGPARAGGKFGRALNFDGADDFVDLGNPAPLRLTGAMTAAAWVRVESDANNGRIISKQGFSGDRGWSLSSEGGEFSFQIAANGSTVHEATAPEILNQWVHVAAVYEPGAAMRVYVNGALAGQKTASVPASQFNSSQNVAIGRRPDGCCAFDGQIDEVRMYNRALNAGEIQELFASSPALAAPQFAGMAGFDAESDTGTLAASLFIDPAFRLGEVYAFPNPVGAGAVPTFHIECGLADAVSLRVYDLAGDLVHEANFPSDPLVIDERYAYEYAWRDPSVASGVYVYVITATKAGETPIKVRKKVAIVK